MANILCLILKDKYCSMMELLNIINAINVKLETHYKSSHQWFLQLLITHTNISVQNLQTVMCNTNQNSLKVCKFFFFCIDCFFFLHRSGVFFF